MVVRVPPLWFICYLRKDTFAPFHRFIIIFREEAQKKKKERRRAQESEIRDQM